ncbi:MAG TPA: V-type ATP synthase subunit I [Thermoplasmata archaeon]|nr:V-type ATP synthase subunit I [Thermoplasmata archaeon]
MGILRPEKMSKVGILGLKDDRDRILTVLQDLRVAQIETLSPDTLANTVPERGSETQRAIGDEALRFRGLKSALPRSATGPPLRFDSLDAILAAAKTVPIDAEVAALTREDDRLLTDLKTTEDTIGLLEKLSFYPSRLEYLEAQSLVSFLGETEDDGAAGAWASVAQEADVQVIPDPGHEERFIVSVRRPAADQLARAAQSAGVHLTPLPPLVGTPAQELEVLRPRRNEIISRRTAIAVRLGEISAAWYPTVAAIDEALQIENRKVEVLTKLGASRSTFALEAWVPARDVARLQQVVLAASGNRAFLYEVPTTEEPPTLMSNPKGVRRFEFFVRFYSLPQADEWDPTLVFAIVFPIFFGLMLGDWGYGLTILLICLWMIAGFPGAQHLPKFGRTFVKRIMGPEGMRQLAYALLPGCAIAIALGLWWDEFFGWHLFGALFGYHALVDPAHRVGSLLLFAGFIGLAMVVLGFLFGLLKEYFHHHPRGVIGKAGGIVFSFGIAFLGLSVIQAFSLRGIIPPASTASPLFDLFLAMIVGGLVMMLGGEGLQAGGMGLIEVVSHILSYTRLIGILLASVILALVINTVVGGLFVGGAVVGILIGAVILLVGQSFNVILGVFEPGIQGARLIFVEYFSKFYTGNGKPFRPFGAPRTHTVSSLAPPGAPPAPIVQAPE